MSNAKNESWSAKLPPEYLGLFTALEAAGEAVVVTDLNATIQYANPEFARQTGYPLEEVIGCNTRVLKSGAQNDAFYRGMWDTLLHGHVWRGELLNRRKDGSFYEAAQTIAPVRGPSGAITGYVSIKRDVTESKRTERLVAEQQARMLESARLAALGMVAGNIAHEIKNPLAVIQGNAELLTDLWQRTELKDSLPLVESITRNVERIERIVRGLNNLARKGDTDLFGNVPIHRLLEDAFEICKPRFMPLKIALHAPPVPQGLCIECRETQIAQVLVNLLSNAMDAVAALPERWVRLDIEENNGSVSLAVTDSGHGLPEPLHEAIFEPFYTTKSNRGSGLGLSISRSIAEAHHGQLWLDTQHPNTRFVMRLPKCQPFPKRAVG